MALRLPRPFFEAEKALNTTHSVSSCQHAAETMGDIQRERRKAAIMFHKFEQGYVALVWQYVRMGRIKEPDTSVVGIITKRFTDILERDHDILFPRQNMEEDPEAQQQLVAENYDESN